MSDRKVYEDEYQFPNDGYVSDADTKNQSNDFHQDESATNTVNPKRSTGLLQNRRFLIIVGAVVAILTLYFWMIHGTKKPTVKPALPSTSSAENERLAKAATMNNEFAAMKSQTTVQQQRIVQLQAQVDQLQSALNEHLNQESQMNNNMSEMMDKLQSMNNELNTLTQKKKSAGPKIVFHLEAIQPGRAWIEDNKGKDITVRVGDRITQYGLVKWIDSDHGIVTTSSGRMITYGANDS